MAEELEGATQRVYGTNFKSPDEGRTFVWTASGWFERIEGNQGNVAFTPFAESEEEVRQLLSQDSPDADFVEFSGEYRTMVLEEFAEQAIDYRDTPAYSEDEDVDEDEDQEYHQHGL